MIRWELANVGVTVLLNTDDPLERKMIEFLGSDAFVDQVRLELSFCRDLSGHIIRDAATGLDLQAAMRSATMEIFDPILTDGGELLKGATKPQPPEGAQD